MGGRAVTTIVGIWPPMANTFTLAKWLRFVKFSHCLVSAVQLFNWQPYFGKKCSGRDSNPWSSPWEGEMLNRTTPPEPKKPRECTKYKRNLSQSPSSTVKVLGKLSKESLGRNFLNDQKMTDYRDLCKSVLAIDWKIGFAGIATADGKILAAEYRQELAPLLSQEESELSIMQSLIRMSTRRTIE